MNDWYKHCYVRLLIDNHISEDDPAFMTKFDPARYVAMVKKAGIESSMVYAVCHNGNSYYPTKVGHMHANLKGRDIFGETVNLLRKEGIVPIAYYTSIYHNHSAKNHPAWRMLNAKGGRQSSGRYWWSCPNNDEYVAFTLAQIGEVIAYDVDGIFNDMTFWPIICVCPNCRTKYLKETGREIPVKLDWRSKEWIDFQRFRERSLAAFTQKITGFIKSKKAITVTHQTSTLMAGSGQAYTLGIAAACDYTSGDFYGGKYQHILGAKVLAAISKNMPYEFMTSRCVDLRDHTSMKSEAELTAEASETLANAGAYFFIDAINPDGTLEQDVYDRLGAVARKLAPFTETVKHHVPDIVADKALYYSSAAYVDANATADITGAAPTGAEIMCAAPGGNPAVEELAGTSVFLTRAHIPFRAISSETTNYEGLNTIVMNNIMYTTPAENERIRKFVKGGGTLIATGLTSLYKPDGATTGDFGLADVFGVSFTGEKAKRFHYLSFVAKHWLISCNASAPLVKAKTAKLIAKIMEPLFDPDSAKYASIHSNPPGVVTDYAGLTANKYGKGQCLYLSSPVFSLQHNAQQTFGTWLFNEYSPSSLVVATNAPECVELTLLKSTTRNAYIAGFVNYQKELPNVPVRDLYATIRLPDGVIPKSCRRVSDNKKIAVKIEQGALRLEVPCLETIEMIEVLY
ncbi:MAG: alpha-L-fucosidase [Kiritimatiellaeota bacterium]|nr:alpha-L-fucosidase [Kiritimatiellota bacterium]